MGCCGWNLNRWLYGYSSWLVVAKLMPVSPNYSRLCGGSEQVSSASDHGRPPVVLLRVRRSRHPALRKCRHHRTNGSHDQTKCRNVQANSMAKDAGNSVEQGREAMNRMSEAIEKIKTSADETAKIIRPSMIAFQTNLYLMPPLRRHGLARGRRALPSSPKRFAVLLSVVPKQQKHCPINEESRKCR